jgi:FkbM family methyltransferase
MSYSQSNEEAEILKYFGDKKGKFLDVGAFNGITFSNIYQLALNGWTGVSIEASPINFAALQHNYKDLPIQLICGAIHAGISGIVKFYDSNGDAVGTTEERNYEIWNKVRHFQEIYITQFTVKNFIKKFGTEFDFISVDTEGTSADLFGYMIELFNPQLWCVEFDDKIDYCIERATIFGYKELYRSGENIIFGK